MPASMTIFCNSQHGHNGDTINYIELFQIIIVENRLAVCNTLFHSLTTIQPAVAKMALCQNQPYVGIETDGKFHDAIFGTMLGNKFK